LDGQAPVETVVAIECVMSAANATQLNWVGAYRTDSSGHPELVGAPLIIPEVLDLTIEYPFVLAESLEYLPEDGNCCPSARDRNRWRFDGQRFLQLGPSVRAYNHETLELAQAARRACDLLLDVPTERLANIAVNAGFTSVDAVDGVRAVLVLYGPPPDYDFLDQLTWDGVDFVQDSTPMEQLAEPAYLYSDLDRDDEVACSSTGDGI
jgi:hypothetical protein